MLSEITKFIHKIIFRFNNCILNSGINGQNLIFWILIVIHLIPIWSFKYFPSQDGPSHIYNASIILDYFNPDYPVFQEYIDFNKSLSPNLLGYVILVGLMYLFPNILVEKIFLSGYVILFPISARYALRAIHPSSSFIAILIFPLIFNFTLHKGFYNFAYSTIFYFFAFGYWIKNRDDITLRNAIVLAIILISVYFFHVFSLLMLNFAIVLLSIWLISFEIKEYSVKNKIDSVYLWKLFYTKIFLVFIAITPTLVLLFDFFYGREVLFYETMPYYRALQHLMSFSSLISYEWREAYFSTAFNLFLVLVSLYFLYSQFKHKTFNKCDGILILALIYVGFYFILPESVIKNSNGTVSGGWIKQRANLFPFFALIIWLATKNYSLSLKRCIIYISIFFSFVFLLLHTMKYHELNKYLDEYLSGVHVIKKNNTLLPICFSADGCYKNDNNPALRIYFLQHASSYIGLQKKIVNLANYEAMTDVFPLKFRKDFDPAKYLSMDGKLKLIPPYVDILLYNQKTDGEIEYVLVWGMKTEDYKERNAQKLLNQLSKNYQLIFQSIEGESLKIYQRKNNFN